MSLPAQLGVRRLLPLLVVCAIAIVAASLLGHTPLDWSEVFHPGRTADRPVNVYWTLRAPRALLGACAGAGLALGGVLLQALFRNPLATPYTLGIASGASLAAAIAFLLNIGGSIVGVPRLSLFAFAGAVVAMSLVYLMARLRGGRDMTRLLLAGVCVAYLSSAGVLLVTFLAGKPVTNDIVIWMMGSLATLRPAAAVEIAIVLVPTLAFALYSHRALDLLSMSDELAASRGVAVERTVWLTYALVGLLTAVIVANCGPIGFVGLMVPHITRTLLGLNALTLTIGSVLIGAAFLTLCDGVARAISVYELPVGIITNMVGAVFFFFLLATRDVSGAGRD